MAPIVGSTAGSQTRIILFHQRDRKFMSNMSTGLPTDNVNKPSFCHFCVWQILLDDWLFHDGDNGKRWRPRVVGPTLTVFQSTRV